MRQLKPFSARRINSEPRDFRHTSVIDTNIGHGMTTKQLHQPTGATFCIEVTKSGIPTVTCVFSYDNESENVVISNPEKLELTMKGTSKPKPISPDRPGAPTVSLKLF
jgi:hypothetical protein